MAVEAFIPARYAATRLPGKPLVDICGRTMVEWVYERASKASLVNHATVATDDERIAEAVRAFGGRVVMTSVECCSGTDRIAEAVAAMGDEAPEIIVNVQGDEPFISPDMIDQAVRPLIDDPGLSYSTLKTKITDEAEYNDPHAVKVVTDSDGFALYFSRSPIPADGAEKGAFDGAFKHIGLYVYRRDFLLEFARMEPTFLEKRERLEQLRALENGIRIKVVETEFNPASVDTEEDLERVRQLASSHDPETD